MNDKKITVNYSFFILIKRILAHARPYWPNLTCIFILTILVTPIALLKPFVLKILIDSGFGSQAPPGFVSVFFPDGFEFSFNTIVFISASLVIIFSLIDKLVGIGIWMLETYTGEKLVLNFKTLLFNHIQRLSLAYHDRKGTSDSLYRIQWDTMCIRSFLTGQLSPLISSFITLISMIIVMFTINSYFAIIALTIIPPLFLLTRYTSKVQKKNWIKAKDDESNAVSVIHEVLSSLRVVKAFGQEDKEGERFINRSNIAVKGQLKIVKVGAVFSLLTGLLFSVATGLFIYFGAHFIKAGEMTLGELTLVLAYLSQVYTPLQNISKSINDVQSSIVSIERVFSVLDEEKEVEEASDAVHLHHVKGSFEFQNLYFSYEKDKPTLRDVSFHINAGDRVGIMGSTGAGKSTLVSLLTRFYDPSSGKILIDGEDIKKFKLNDYRRQFSIVLQEPVLFSTTIIENIRYGRPEATQKEVMEAAKAANAYDFILKSKDGLDTLVGERGMQLSGGERQRISIARAFIKNAPVLILDEPTSSVDIQTEAQIMEAMERLMEGRTTFMITHRLDTLNNCNVVLNIEEGRLVEIVRDQDIKLLIKNKKSFSN